MLRSLLTALAIGLTAPAMAFDIDAMTTEEREAFRTEIRAYLMENPEVLMEAIAVLEGRRAEEAAEQEKLALVEMADDIYNDGHSWVAGNPEGDVTVVEFLDYRCGFCKRAYPDVMALVEGDSNIRLIVKEFPILGPESELAARFALATKRIEGDDAYARVHDAMMTWQGAINQGALGRIGNAAGLSDLQAVTAEMDNEEITQIIAENRALGQALQIQGTPSFIMGDQFVRGYAELPQMQEIIAAIREEQG